WVDQIFAWHTECGSSTIAKAGLQLPHRPFAERFDVGDAILVCLFHQRGKQRFLLLAPGNDQRSGLDQRQPKAAVNLKILLIARCDASLLKRADRRVEARMEDRRIALRSAVENVDRLFDHGDFCTSQSKAARECAAYDARANDGDVKASGSREIVVRHGHSELLIGSSLSTIAHSVNPTHTNCPTLSKYHIDRVDTVIDVAKIVASWSARASKNGERCVKPKSRQASIVALVERDGEVTVDGLAAEFRVSPETIRRDLATL